jgi:hypothetical protein
MRTLLVLFLVACGGGGTPSATDAPLPIDAPGTVEPPYRCDFADCKDDFARSCGTEADQQLDCSAFGASCAPFTDTESGAKFNWCNCGTIAEGDGKCTGGRYGIACVDGLGGLADCGAGYLCVPRPNGPFGIGCECNNLDDGVCPGVACSADPDCSSCTPSCSGKQCGDNGCGGECGTCDLGETCTSQQQCVSVCVPNCTGKTCGSDGCGGSCGTCGGGGTCNSAGTCDGPCVPSCTGKTCGSDGCGGTCGSCAADLECGLKNTCECDFFATTEYTFKLPPQGQWPAAINAVGVNVQHIKIDGTFGTPGGDTLGYGNATLKQSFTYKQWGCRPKIEIERHYIVNFKSCKRTDVVEGKTSFVIPPPIINADGSCTAPPL